MARSRWNWDYYRTDSIVVSSLAASIAADGGMVKTPAVKFTIPCAFQPISGDKVLEFQQINIIATHVALTNQVYAIAVGDSFTNNGLAFDITYFEAEGGALNPIGPVFAIYGKVRLNR